MTDSLLSEVDADVRAERMYQLWMRYRMRLLTVIIAIITLTAASSIRDYYHEKQGGELMLAFSNAQKLYDAGKFGEAADGFASITKNTRGETLTIAQLWEGRALAAAGKKDEAIAILKTASARKPGLWSDLACLRLASLDMDAAICLNGKKDTALSATRREWKAANLWAAGDKQGAITALEELETRPDTPEPARTRISQWLATMRAEANTAEK